MLHIYMHCAIGNEDKSRAELQKQYRESSECKERYLLYS